MSSKGFELRRWRKTLPAEKKTLQAVADLFQVSLSQMSRLERGERKVPAERCAEFEAVTGIPRETLRPDVFGPATVASRRTA